MRKADLPTPCFIIDEGQLKKNLEILQKVKMESGCKILLAQKAFSSFYEYPLIGRYLDGATASGLYEARLGAQEMGLENHIFSPGYKACEIDEITDICGHVIFNSFNQLERYGDICRTKGVSIGLRINPEHSTQDHAIYDPCGAGSRLGVTKEEFLKGLERLTGDTSYKALAGLVDGLHFHSLCEQDSDALEETLDAVIEGFGEYLPHIKWLNMGGGHHITRADYDVPRLLRCIKKVKDEYGLEVYLEPGEAVALNAGELVTEVMDIVTNNDKQILILDASAACHMPDVIEMPYRPPLKDSGMPYEKEHTYILSSCTCLAGDVIGEYSFDHEIKVGEKLYFGDMAIYSMVKTNTFNGMALPSIAVMEEDGSCHVIKSFGYEDFKCRLG